MKKKLAIPLLAMAAALPAAFAALWLSVGWSAGDADEYAGGTVLRDSSGRIMRVAPGEDGSDRRPRYEAEPGDWIVKAVVAAEDGEFWTHCGVRPLSVLRAAFQNISSGRRVSGASTITMQTARLLEPHPKTLGWKCVEAVKALKMEREKDKLWILTQYLDRAPFGSNFVGVEAAANGWFGKSAKDLGLGEAACLAGMIQAPSFYRPDRAPERLAARREYVLARMEKLGYATHGQRLAAASVFPASRRPARPFRHPHFCDWALSSLGGGRGDFTTSLDADIQGFCESVVGEARQEGGYSAAAVVLRVRDCSVAALACSGDYFGEDGGQVNTALAPRPAGSTLKPFLAALAFDRGLATPEERLDDSPCVYEGYRPANFDNMYRGSVSVRDSLVLSLNIPFVRLLERVGVSRFGTLLRSAGFGHMPSGDETLGLGLAIGNAEVSLLELAAAYAALARNGVYLPPVCRAGAGGAGVRVFSAEASYLVSDMLSGDERSYSSLGHIADVAAPRFAWKTGTSSGFRDAWTVAWNPEYVVGVWCGRKSGGFGDESLVGAKACAPRCWKIARLLYPRNDGPWFHEPDGVFRREICAKTGLPAGCGCEKTETGRAIAGRSPDVKCSCRSAVAKTEPKILKPAPNTVFRAVEGFVRQKIVCLVAGNPDGSRLWWFDNGEPKGSSAGSEPFAFDMAEGRHLISCSTADGRASSVEVTVL
ncbi:MAG: transglycosylase domain-containing protein [Kiritimatiellae bacterium]|nr:transglycosylase domain-containing protein [Kiritimatiellia bacterium]